MTHPIPAGTNRVTVSLAILGLGALYVAALVLGWPQLGTQRVVEAQAHHAAADDAAPKADDHPPAPMTAAAPAFWTVLPFVLL